MDDFRPDDFFDIKGQQFEEFFSDIEYIWDAVAGLPGYIERIIEPKLLGELEDGAWLEPGNVQMEEGSRVERGAIVRGPTIIGKDSVIRSGAYIRGHVMVGKGCMIGHGTEIRQVLVLNQSNIPHNNCFFTSVVGNNVRIGGCADTANFRLDGKEISILFSLKDKKFSFPTGQSLFGAIVGDGSSVGGKSLLMPGTLIGRQCRIYPQCTISGYIPHNSIVKPISKNFEIITNDQSLY
jgi:NDP-sugar pyrophosphorylase family protein